MISKAFAILNWLFVAGICLVVVAELLSPNKGGGDAATRGFGPAFYTLAIIAIVVVAGLNLLPYGWTKYVAFGLACGLFALPMLYFQLWPTWQERKTLARNEARYAAEAAAPIFEDAQRDQIARVIRDGNVSKLKAMLQAPIPRINEKGGLIAFAINQAAYANVREEETLEAVRMLFAAGAVLDSTKTMDVPPHFAAAEAGHAALLRLLLEHGADANAIQINFGTPILFAAIMSNKQPEESVRALLDSGANPNSAAVINKDDGPMSPLWRAARMDRWAICAALLEHGADPNTPYGKGPSFRDFVENAEQHLSAENHSGRAEFERMKKALHALPPVN